MTFPVAEVPVEFVSPIDAGEAVFPTGNPTDRLEVPGVGSFEAGAAGGGERDAVTFGHPSGTLKVGPAADESGGEWRIEKVVMSRSARVLMEGWVRVPGDAVL